MKSPRHAAGFFVPKRRYRPMRRLQHKNARHPLRNFSGQWKPKTLFLR
jgi:hypothetical protein